MTLRSDAAWSAGHRAAVPFAGVAAAGAIAGAFVAVAAGDERNYTIGVLAGAGWLTAWLLVGARRAVLAARRTVEV